MTSSTFNSNTSWLPLRLALRELRGGLRGFYVFIACIALGVMAIAGIGSLSSSLVDGLARDGRIILGGDLAFALSHREATVVAHYFRLVWLVNQLADGAGDGGRRGRVHRNAAMMLLDETMPMR